MKVLGVLLAGAWLALAPAARADAPSLVWEQSTNVTFPGEGTAVPLAARLLADGTVGVVFHAGLPFLVSVRYGESAVESAALIEVPHIFSRAELDPFGDVLVMDYRGPGCSGIPCPPEGYGDAWVMKFDGGTGQALWEEPFLWDGPAHLGDRPFAITVDPNGDALLGVLEDDYHHVRFLRIDGSDGQLLWASGAFLDSWSASMAFDGSDAVVAVGRLDGSIAVSKLDGGTGANVWGPTVIDPWLSGLDGPGDLAIDAGGDPVLLSWTGASTVVTRFLGSNGSLLWSHEVFVPLFPTFFQDLIVSRDGQHLAAGGSGVVALFDAETGVTIWLRMVPVSLDSSLNEVSNGDLVQTAIISSSGTFVTGSMRLARDGAVLWGPVLGPEVTTGFIESLIDGQGRIVEIAQRQSDGKAHFQRRDGSDGQPSGPPIEFAGLTRRGLLDGLIDSPPIDPSGNVVVVVPGATSSKAVSKLAKATGSRLWTFDVPDASGLVRVAVDAQGDVVLFAETSVASVLWKLDGSSGLSLWGPLETGPPPDSPGGLAVAQDGTILTLTTVTQPSIHSLVRKHTGANGSLIWGPVTLEHSTELEVGPNGDVFVLATPWVVTKLSGTTGAILWGPVIQDQAIAEEIAATPQGNLVAAGESFGPGGHAVVLQYDGLTGSTSWGPVAVEAEDGGGTWFGGLAIDPSGDVFLSASTTTLPVSARDVRTARLSGSNGAFVWGPVTHDSGNQEEAIDVGLDPFGNPVVVGAASYGETEYQSLMIGYDADDGSVLWGPVHGGVPSDFPEVVGSGGGQLYVFHAVSPQVREIVRAFSFSLGIATPPGEMLVTCGEPLSFPLEAANETGAVSWSLESGALPAGVTLSPQGVIAGPPVEVGEFPIRVRVEDSTTASATRDLTIVVRWNDPIPIVVTPLSDCQFLLQVSGSWDSYAWEPGGETTPSIVVSPFHDTVYGLTVGESAACLRRGAILVRATRRIDSACEAPGILSMTPTSGPASGGTLVTLTGIGFQAGASVRIGALDAAGSVVGTVTATATTPALQPGALHTVLLTNPDAASAFSPSRFFADFLDVDQGHLFHAFVESILRSGVTAGCGEGNYCPDAVVRRDQIAVFLLRSRYGPSYEPPPATGTVFGDVNIGTFAGNYIEALAAAGVTAGCGGGNYCPTDPVTREQVAVFLLRTLEGPTYVPPPCTSPTFSDVPCSSGFAPWVEELVTRGITAGCGGGLYCPLLEVTRGQIAVFLTETFGLGL